MDVRSVDFAKLRATVAERLRPRALGQFTALTRTIFTFAYDSDLIPVPVRHGSSFERPDKRLVRVARQKRGPMLISSSDLRKMIDAADTQVRAFELDDSLRAVNR